MKELSIEEKAKAYDMALDKIERLLDIGDNCSRKELEHVFPELKESEDERIIERIKKAVESYWSDEPLDEILAWLEKQGEQTSDKIVEKARTEKQRILLTETDGSANIDWDCRSLDDVKTLLKCGLEFIRTIEFNKQILTDRRFGGCSFRVPTRYDKDIKQGEQKPYGQRKECLDCQFNYAGECKGYCALKRNEQKPTEWSEEDEDMWLDAIKYLELFDAQGIHGNKAVPCINWLKSLKDWAQPQPKQEWSEEDKNNILFLTSIIEECFKDKKKITLCGDTVCANFTKEDVIDRLKSLRPQPHWKPSDEQMHYLSWVANIKLGDSVVEQEVSKRLNELLEDLKKLRGE